MIYITMNDLQKDPDQYLSLAEKEEVIVIKNRKPYIKITSISEKESLVNELAGCIKLEKSYEELMDERYSAI